MEIKVLKDLGFTDGEVRVYLALLEIGSSTAGAIIEKSKISPSKIYHVLDRLVAKGIVSYILRGKVKHFRAVPPRNILNYIERKENDLAQHKNEFRKIIPLLESKQKLDKKNFNAQIFEGISGLITVFDMSFEESKKGDTVYAFGYPPYASRLFDKYWRGYYSRCDKKGVVRKIIYNYETWFLKKRSGRELTFNRYLPKGISTPSLVLIFNDKIAIVIITEEQKACFLIQNKEVAYSYIQYFNFLWKNAIKP